MLHKINIGYNCTKLFNAQHLLVFICVLQPPICYLPKYQSDHEDSSAVVTSGVFVVSAAAPDLMYQPDVVVVVVVVVVGGGGGGFLVVFSVSSAVPNQSDQ